MKGQWRLPEPDGAPDFGLCLERGLEAIWVRRPGQIATRLNEGQIVDYTAHLAQGWHSMSRENCVHTWTRDTVLRLAAYRPL
jgi:hypothetical protein